MMTFRMQPRVFMVAMLVVLCSCVSAVNAQATSLRQGMPLDALVNASGLQLGELRVPMESREPVRAELMQQGVVAALVDVRVLASIEEAREVFAQMTPSLASQGVEQRGAFVCAGPSGGAMLAAFSAHNIVVIVRAISGRGVDAEALAHALSRVVNDAPRGMPSVTALPAISLQPGETRIAQTPSNLAHFVITAEGDGYARRVANGFVIERRQGMLTVTSRGVDLLMRFVH